MRYLSLDFWRDVVDAVVDAWNDVQNQWNDPKVALTPCRPLAGCPKADRVPGVKGKIVFADGVTKAPDGH